MSRPMFARAAAAALLAALLVSCAEHAVAPNDPTSPRLSRDVGTASTGLVINEVMSDPTKVADASGEWFEIRNTTAAPVNLFGYRILSGTTESHTITGFVIVPAGGYVVLGNNIDSLANGGVPVAYSYGTSITLNNSNTDWLKLVAVDSSVVDSVSYSQRDSITGAITTPTFTPTSGTSRGLLDPTADNATMATANWANATSTYGLGDRGTPGALNDSGPPPPPPPSTGNVVITEILANPSVVLDNVGEWFEVHNRDTLPVNLQGWTIASNNDTPHVIASSVSIAAGAYAVLARNADQTVNGAVTVAYAYDSTGTGLNLSNTSDWIAIRNAAGATIDSVFYAASAPNGSSRALIDPASDNTDVDGSAWFTSFTPFGAGDNGTPGQPSFTGPPPVPGVIAFISLGITPPAQVPIGYTKPLFPTARDGFGTIVSPPPPLTWSSSDTGVATVDTLGYVTGTGVGTATIGAAAPNGITGTIVFTIIPGVAPTPAIYRNHLEFGTPSDGSPGDDIHLTKAQFALSYSEARGGPNWVSWNINSTHFGPQDRCNCFTADQTLPPNVYRVVDFDYRNGGYDRGHMVQSFSRTTTDQENATTFLLTNILPQAAENNQGPWAQAEIFINDLANVQNKELYVIAGGEYETTPPTLKDEGKVQIPAFTWKVAVVLDAGEGLPDVQSLSDLQVIAIRMPNYLHTAAGIRNLPWQQFQTTVDDIESRIGYDLLASLPDAIELVVESNDRAPVAEAGGPYAGTEGSGVTFSGAGSSDPDGDSLTYAWDFGDGSAGSGVSPSHAYGDNGTFTVTLTVTDPFGLTSVDTDSVIVANADPVVAAVAGASLIVGETYGASGTFTDPGADTWTGTVNYGDGGGAQPLSLSGRSFTLSHQYTAAGTFIVGVTITDDDQGSGTDTATVTVLSPVAATQALIAQVNALVAAGVLTPGQGLLLNSSVRFAQLQLQAGNDTPAIVHLRLFIGKVNVLVAAGRLTPAQGAALEAYARRIIASVGQSSSTS